MTPRFNARTLLSLLALLCALVSGVSHAQIPRTINYQGYLTTPSGAAVNNGNLTMTFKLYDAVTLGTVLHNETQTVTVTNGIFNVLLGTSPALTLPFTKPYFLGVTVAPDTAEMTPRRPLSSAPYAVSAENIAPGGNINLSNSTATVGNVYIGGFRFMHGTGTANVFLGRLAGDSAVVDDTFFYRNTAIGYESLKSLSVGIDNVVVGAFAGRDLSGAGGAATRNTAVGAFALRFGTSVTNSVAVGSYALHNSTGNGNIGIGDNAAFNLMSGSNNIIIGNQGVTAESNAIRLGNSLHTRTFLSGNVGFQLGAGSTPDRPVTIQASGAQWIGLRDSAGANKWHINHKNGGVNFAETGLVDGRLFLAAGGNVGIGTDTPTRATLEVLGSNTTALGAAYRVNSAGGAPLAASSYNLTVYASNAIAANEFLAFSDQRMKRVLGRSNAARDLATIDAIEITDYTHIDTANRGDKSHKKVIAQQVEKIFPQAVNKITDLVPDIYQRAAVKDGWITVADHAKANRKKGERVRLIGNSTQGVYEVLEVAAGRFRTAFKADADTVFVYGREVNDFRTVDYEAIAMLNVSATQELNRRVAAQAAEIAALKTQLAQLGDLQEKVAALMAQSGVKVASK